MLFIQLVCKYAGVGEGNLFFFGGGEKREGKSSFCFYVDNSVGRKIKMAFYFA